MRKVMVALAGTAVGAMMLIGLKASQGAQPGQGTGRLAGGAEDVAPGPAGGTSTARVVLPPGDYSVTGPSVDTPFGPVRVRVTVSGGRIVDVTAPLTPSEHSLSVEINKSAVPRLRQEVLQAQSARIDVVSGATYTSDAYARSLQAALDKAAAGQRD